MSQRLLHASLKRSASAVASRSNNNIARRSMASSENLVKTSLNQWHKDLGGEMVPFAGYELPVLYKGDKAPNGGVMKEHLWCRSEGKASLFDVSHMGQVRELLQTTKDSMFCLFGFLFKTWQTQAMVIKVAMPNFCCHLFARIMVLEFHKIVFKTRRHRWDCDLLSNAIILTRKRARDESNFSLVVPSL